MKTHLHRVTLAVSSALLVAGCSTGASAQWSNSVGGVWNNPTSSLASTMVYNRLLLDAAKKKTAPEAEGARAPQAQQKSPSVRRLRVSTTFRPVAPSLMVQDLAQGMGKTPAERAQLAEAFGQFLGIFEDQARADKELHDLARAAAFFLVANYAIASGREPTEKQTIAVEEKFRGGLSGSQQLGAMSDREKQKLYETLVIFGSLPVAGRNSAKEKRDAEQQKMFRRLARENIQTLLGVPVEKIHLTDEGLSIAD
ncbi:MAG: hypothetical protein LAN62_01820 [Acidobacteriia bacterium]|nr:hypothetical protein [Terriglobia bacterium]